MEALTKARIESWVKKHDWLPIFETATPTGKQITYLTPSGEDRVLVYDLQENLCAIGRMVQLPARIPGLNIPGLDGRPIIGQR